MKMQKERKYSPDQIQNIKTQKNVYYRPAQIVKGWFTDRFDYRFQSIQNSIINQGFCATLATVIKLKTKYQNLSVPKDLEQLQRRLPINKNPNFDCPQNKIKYTWIGHSTAVISIGGKYNLLIDPVFSDRASPFQIVGPKRFRQPACKINQLPKIDMVLVSHDHYDHLDKYSIQELQKTFKPQFVAGLNSKDVFPDTPSQRLHQLDWTQTKIILLNGEKFQITFFPVCHWSKRWLFDTGKRLWGGFIIKTPKGHKILYTGDTGYCQVFKQIGQKFGPIDLCILPIGAYEPRQFLKSQHVNPQQAVLMHQQLKSNKSVGVHWGTFPLGWQNWYSARDDLRQAVQKYKLKQDQFITIGHGDSFQIQYQIKK